MNRERLKQVIGKCADKGLTLFCWAGALLLLWGVMQVFCFTSFKIPSDSMEPELIAGDYIAVNKLTQGARLFNVFDALNKKEVAIHRLPGIGEIERNDVLVFNFPYPARWDSIGFDVIKYYVKRCVALPGDTFEIRKAQYQVRGVNTPLGNVGSQREMERILASEQDIQRYGIVTKGYPYDSIIGWNIKEFGPLYVPKQDGEIEINRTNWILYRTLIEWEQKKRLTFKDETFFLGGHAITSYRFRKNYYFMTGDKAMNSQDSRYWGLLPEEFIVGKATFIWKSKDLSTGDIRWDRVWKRIE